MTTKNKPTESKEMYAKLKHFISLKKGKNPTVFLDSGSYPYLTMDYLRGRDKDIKYVEYNKNLVWVEDDEILILWDGANAGEIINSKAGFLSSTMAKISLKTPKIKKRFLFFLLKRFEPTLKDFSGGTTIPHLDVEKLLHSSFFIPSLNEQEQIASFLDDKTSKIDLAIAQKEKMIGLLKERKQIIIQNAVTKGLNPNAPTKHSGVEWIGEIPAHWEVKKLKFLGGIYAGINGKKGDDFSKENNGNMKPFIPFTNICNNLKIANNQYQYVKIHANENQNKVKFNDILFLMSSETLEDIAKNSIYLGTDNELYLNSFCKGYRVKSPKINPEFLNYLLFCKTYRNYFSIVGRGFTRVNLKQEFINDAYALIPPLSEQSAIVAHIEAQSAKIDKAIDLQARQIAQLKELKATLIDSAVTGKIKVS